MKPFRFISLLLLIFGQARLTERISGAAVSSTATILYVDGLIGSGSCANYDPATRSCAGGSAKAYGTLAGVVTEVQMGDEVLIRDGTYSEQLRPQNSGSAGNPITFRNYQTETVTLLSGASPATIILDGVDFIIIEGLNIEDSRWLEATNANDNIIRDNTFLRTPASGTTGNVRFINSDHNQIVGNVFEDGNDNLLLIASDYNLIQDNTFREGRHSLLSVRCSNYNVIRDNYFSNTQQKIAEIYDCGDDTSAVPHAFDATHHNVIEGNVFAEASAYYSTSGGNGIQYAGQDGIIRRNVFYHTNVGLGMQVYADEALYNQHNRVYHNVFYENNCAGIAIRADAVDNIYKNNILYKNKGISGDCNGVGPAQMVYRSPLAQFRFERNNLLNTQPGEAVIQEEFGSGNSLGYFEVSFPNLFANNLELDPGFIDETAFEFRLKSASPMLDGGAFLASTATTGSGTTLAVEDARYFHNGFGISGIAGDLIQLAGQTETARVISVDYSANTLVLDKVLSWSSGQGVSLAYTGAAPDIGAYEFIPSLQLVGIPTDQAIHLNWTVSTMLPVPTTWKIDYYSQFNHPAPITGVISPTRAYTLTGLANYTPYSVTLSAMQDNTPFLTDTIIVTPTDLFIYLPVVAKEQ
jgi:hypothetical protein